MLLRHLSCSSLCHVVEAEALEAAEPHNQDAEPVTASLWQPLTPACQQDAWPKYSPFPIWLSCLVDVSCTTGPFLCVLCTETHQLIHSWFLISGVSDLCTQDNCSLCLWKLTLGVLLLTLASTDLACLNRQEFQPKTLLLQAYQVTMNHKKRKIKLHMADHKR